MAYLNQAGGASGGSPATVDYVTTQAVSSTNPSGSPMAGPLTMANQGAAPAASATGAVVYSVGGVLTYVNPQGLVQTIVGSQPGITAPVTVVNNASEAVLQSLPMPANDAIAGAVYKMFGWGTYSDTGTPTLAFTSRLGGVAGTVLATVPAITLGAGLTGAPFKYEVFLAFLSPTSVQCMIELDLGTNPATAAASPYVGTPTTATTVSLSTAKTWVLDVTWSAASASNTITLGAGYTERVA